MTCLTSFRVNSGEQVSLILFERAEKPRLKGVTIFPPGLTAFGAGPHCTYSGSVSLPDCERGSHTRFIYCRVPSVQDPEPEKDLLTDTCCRREDAAKILWLTRLGGLNRA